MARAQTHKVYGFAAMMVGPLVAPGLMLLGALGVLVLAWGLRVWCLGGAPWSSEAQERPLIMALCTALVLTSGAGCSALGWKAFKHNRSTHSIRSSGKGWLLGPHVLLTVVGAHVSMLLFVWFGSREFTWATWILGTIFIGTTWIIRRFARESSTLHEVVDEGKELGLPGSQPFFPPGH